MIAVRGSVSYVTIDGVRLHWEERGEGPALLLVHGFGQSSYVWRFVCGALGEYRTTTLDLKGSGASDKPADGKYSPLDQAALLARFIETVELQDFTLVGHSLGGAVSLQLATRYAVRLRSLVLMDSAAFFQRLPYFMRLFRPPVLGELVTRLGPPRIGAHMAMWLSYRNREAATADAIEQYANAFSSPGGRQAMLATARQMIPADMAAFTAGYDGISVPTLIIWGRQDPIVPLNVGLRLAQTIPGSRLEVIDDCGHCPQEERPEETVRLMREFLQSLLP